MEANPWTKAASGPRCNRGPQPACQSVYSAFWSATINDGNPTHSHHKKQNNFANSYDILRASVRCE